MPSLRSCVAATTLRAHAAAAGDWQAVGELLTLNGLGGHYDVILAAETIYSRESQQRLLGCIKQVSLGAACSGMCVVWQRVCVGASMLLLLLLLVLKHCEVVVRCVGLPQVLQPPHGVALIAAKSFYFGVGGSTAGFAELVKDDGVLECSQVCADGGTHAWEH